MNGERKGDRDVMDRVTKRLIDHGVKPEVAREHARESMKRTDRDERERGRR